MTIDESTLTHNNHPQVQFTLGFTVGVVYSVGLDKRIMTCIHHYGIIKTIFTFLTIYCTLPIHPFLPANPWQPLIFLLLP